MSLIDEIRAAQIAAGEAAVIRRLKQTALVPAEPETLLQPNPICPKCGHEHRDAWEWFLGQPGLEGASDRECESCGAPFHCERVVTVEYTTKALPPNAQADARPKDVASSAGLGER